VTDAFDWLETENVTVRTQMAIAVYLNPHGELVIRQEGQFHPDEDVWVVIAPDNVPAVIEAMQQAMGMTAGSVTKDPTAAHRQRRHRDKHRDNRDVVTPVTVANTVTDRDVARSDRDKLPLLAAAE
jgi:hypothetical protein